MNATTRIGIVGLGLMLVIGVSSAVAVPSAPGYPLVIYDGVPTPMRTSFDQDSGWLYVGSLATPGGAIHRVGLGGYPIEQYGPELPDPDAVLFDRDGTISGTPGSVLVGGAGQISAILPDQTAAQIFAGPSESFVNPQRMKFDHAGRLVFCDPRSATQGLVFVSSGESPTPLFDYGGSYSALAFDDEDRIYTAAGQNGTRVQINDRDGVLVDSSFATPGNPIEVLAFGPPDAPWDGDLYAVTRYDGYLHRIDAVTGEITVIGDGFQPLRDVAFRDNTLYVVIEETLPEPPCPDAGLVALDREAYACESEAGITVTDCGLNEDDTEVETVTVEVDSDSEPAGESVVLTETAPDSAEFTGAITLSETDADGVLMVAEGDFVTVTYIDADDGEGGVDVEVTATATVDCTAPVISDVETAEVGAFYATVTFLTDEPARGSVRYGESCDALTGTTEQGELTTDQSVRVSGLREDTTYFYAVDAEDAAGNTASDDNGGACYSFLTAAHGQVTIETVTVGNPGNPDDTHGDGYGGVGHIFNIGKYEVTAGQYAEFLNAVAATDTYGLYNTSMWSTDRGCKIERTGSPGSYRYSVADDWADRPVNAVNWGDAARFSNWLHNGQPTGPQDLTTTEDGSYFLDGAMSDAELLAVTRAADATWAIPSEDEWYKATYHYNDGATGNYFDFPTSSDSVPSNDLIDPDPGNNATYNDGDYTIGSPYWRTEVGEHENSDSPYGTFDQGGNVFEWNEAVIGSHRGGRGGSYSAFSDESSLHAAYRLSNPPTVESSGFGFRVAQISEPEAGSVSLDRDAYACESEAAIAVADRGLNEDDTEVETVTVEVDSDSEPTGESVVLTETAPASAEFTGAITLSETDADGVLMVAEGDFVTVTYIDADDGEGGVDVEVTATATIDCTAPVISDVETAEVGAFYATVTFQTDEPARGSVRFGESCDALTGTTGPGELTTDQSVRVSGLREDTTYFYAVDAEDAAGNLASDDNGGACYSFSTTDVPNYFTEPFDGDNDLAYLSLTFEPGDPVDYYVGCVEAIDALPTDPAGGSVIPLSDDDGEELVLDGGAMVSLYGVSYGSLFAGSNGNVTLESRDTDYTESLEDHFSQPRISVLFDDFNPSEGGTVSWRQLADRVAVTWEDVPEYGTSNASTFQVELFFDGLIRLSYERIDAPDGLSGLSAGGGVPGGFVPTDLSEMGGCGVIVTGVWSMARHAASDGYTGGDIGLPIDLRSGLVEPREQDPSEMFFRLAFVADVLPDDFTVSIAPDPGLTPTLSAGATANELTLAFDGVFPTGRYEITLDSELHEPQSFPICYAEGDVNCSGDTTGLDLARIQNPTNWNLDLSEAADPRADVNRDGQVTALDLQVAQSPANWNQPVPALACTCP